MQTAGVLENSFPLCSGQFRWLFREVRGRFPKHIASLMTPCPQRRSPHQPLRQPPSSIIESKHFNTVSKAMAMWPLPGPRISSFPLALWVAATLGCLSDPVHFQEGSFPDCPWLSPCLNGRFPDRPSLTTLAERVRPCR